MTRTIWPSLAGLVAVPVGLRLVPVLLNLATGRGPERLVVARHQDRLP